MYYLAPILDFTNETLVLELQQNVLIINSRSV